MIVGIDLDGTLVRSDGRRFDDTTSALDFAPGAEPALRSLKAARHVLLLLSSRANRALREDPELDPLIAAGVVRCDRAAWARAQPLHVARYDQMRAFWRERCQGLIDAVDDGRQGKPLCDLFLDDKAFRGGGGLRPGTYEWWWEVAMQYGDPSVWRRAAPR